MAMSEYKGTKEGWQQLIAPFTDGRFDLRSKLNQRSVQAGLADLRPHEPLRAPYVVEIDPTTACNLECPECISGSLLNHGSLPTGTLLALIDDLAAMGTKAVIFIGGGEPMAHRDFSRLVRHAAQAGLRVGITTNGTLIRRHLDAVAACAAWTRVSIDAGTAESFAFFRPSQANRYPLESVIEQMAELAAGKKGDLGYSFLILECRGRSNVSEILEAARIAREVGCDYLEVKPAMNLDHTLMHYLSSHTDLVLEQLQRCRELETDSFKVHVPVTLLHVVNGNGNLDQPKDYHWCPAIQYRTVITPSGCYVCPYHRGHQPMRYGDLRTQSFREIWQGEGLRHVFRSVDPSRDCRFHCIRHRQNLHLLSSQSNGDRDAPVEDYDLFI